MLNSKIFGPGFQVLAHETFRPLRVDDTLTVKFGPEMPVGSVSIIVMTEEEMNRMLKFFEFYTVTTTEPIAVQKSYAEFELLRKLSM